MATANPQRGYLLGIIAYVVWGLFPLYFKAMAAVPSVEIIVHRVLWSALFGTILLILWKHPGWWRELRDNPKRLAILTVSGLLIASNWLVYVWAVNSGRMLEASLGYYINPLINVLLGMLLLGERLRRLQWVAVGLATVGVLQQLWQVGSLPWVSLFLALTFGFYGLIRKKAPVAALPGLVMETWLLLPVALIWLFLHPAAVSSQVAFWGTSEALWLIAAGPVTLIPLLCFNAAARHLPYTALGFLQYIAPTLVMLLAVLVYGETLEASKLLAFVFIWAGLVVYSVDIWLSLRRRGQSKLTAAD
ncbi:EamA family transporter RarD [Ectopseudomonas oleovorans]|uniref:EamA family transporter RarD n=1 Tax=Ectopseudomonas oleovorans TaxID=301 RepID=A0AA42Q7K6_ECTOL|nr:EamA family transporter RarD [Pseudomonas oleovorans]MDH1338707.1 EamA family transporter RarD [Pseudomonas oleovorans]MDH1492634.1 EamA family transporter RarD [Pseudomonas oleovorans]WGG20614.1 EamA family transporter RarD [Pseudomonas oleovorans]